MKQLAVGLVVGMCVVGAAVFAQTGSGPAREVPYQGRLEFGGSPVNAPTTLEFFFVDAEAKTFDDAYWSELHPDVPISNGTFAVRLGQTTAIEAEDLAKPTVWVGVRVGGFELTGKQPLLPVAYAVDSLGTPAGTVVAFAGAVPPPGWLICDGTSVDRAQYPRLSDALGTTFGGNATVVQLPDLRGRVPLGLDNQGGAPANRVQNLAADVLGGAGGRERTTNTIAHTHGLQADGAHGHNFPDSCNGGTLCVNGADGFVRGARTGNLDIWIGTAPNHDHGGATLNSGNVASLDNMPPYLGLRYIIKY